MKNHFKLLLFTAALGLATVSACGATFNFSYEFYTGGDVWTGTLEGILSADGQFVDNVHDVTMFVNGNQLSGPISVGHAVAGGDPLGTFVYIENGGSVISFDALKCNFNFSNGNSYFEVIPDFMNNVEMACSSSSWDDQVVVHEWLPDHWHLTVPDGGQTLSMLALAMVGLGWMRRKA